MRRSDIFIAILLAFAAPLGLAVATSWVPGLVGVTSVFFLASFPAILLVPLGMGVGLLAMSRGLAGWASALLGGALAGWLFLFIVGSVNTLGEARETGLAMRALICLIGSPYGMVYAILLWLVLRWRRPEAVAPR
ncbi:hypothetical protein [Pelagovum pacificum]|uniref:Uncharacterized protein n=1 Tax=Pelagovum pacificum TaxID=2588711 RepID=A0A5C5GEV1_9RHOB|nr:hypothetical protein [Pelagovum pacificum]QQA44127.1 hypothetical protein I8N54_05990 [Pelagovum pacificum]TNY32744.1 hypothetical protein FHY64_05570 [Pelagovum pacificum]